MDGDSVIDSSDARLAVYGDQKLHPLLQLDELGVCVVGYWKVAVCCLCCCLFASLLEEMVNQKLQELPPKEQDTIKGKNMAFRAFMGESNQITVEHGLGNQQAPPTIFRAHSQACMESKMDVHLFRWKSAKCNLSLI